ncbi:hypothetical protein DV515_00018585 [Chloebia gouldiae]|uniref:Peptidase A2 domain-containing protein n=1 Tax=Chloebia gouldiae TaxID=44316 RepID=A0A3L8Q7J9_CHLGU|nr:hypothetical protein DV515_00018585 [Chloebia gouldiae]
MVHTPFPPLCIMKGQKIAQLVPLEQMTKTLVKENLPERGEKGFGSKGGLTLLTVNLHDRPKREIEIEYQGQRKTFMSLLDMGSDSSIISPEHWPNDWPLMPTATTVTGIGGLQLASQSPLLKATIDGKRISATFSVVTLPPTVQCLICRDILVQLGIKLLSDLQWLRPIVEIPNELLATLRPLLQGTDPTHRVHVSSEQKNALEKILDCFTQGQVFRRNLKLPLDLTVWNGPTYLLAAITQLLKKTGEIRVLEWISPTLQQTKTLFQKIEMMAELIKKGRETQLK